MAINFPSTLGQPTDGSFTHSENGVSWSWDGATWKAQGLTGTYTLPIASTSLLGGVKLGSNLAISTTGILSALVPTLTLDNIVGNGNTTSKGIFVGVITSPGFVKVGGTIGEFLKADGSTDSNVYLTSLGDAAGVTTTKIEQWDTAYGWGDHSTVGYSTIGYVDTQIGLNTFTGTASTITSVDLDNWNTAYGWGDHSVEGYLTTESDTLNDVVGRGNTASSGINISGVVTAIFSGNGTGITSLSASELTGSLPSIDGSNLTGLTGSQISGVVTSITAGGNITILEFPTGNYIITSAGGGAVGSAGTWAVNAAGIHTTKNVGIGTELSTSALTVEGDGRFSGVVTATRFESTSSGTPSIDSPNNLNINAINVAVSTDLSVGGNLSVSGILTTNAGGITVGGAVTATAFYGDGSNLTGVSGGGGTGYFEQTDVGIHTLSNVGVGTTNPTSALTVSGDVSVTGVVTATSFYGDGSTLSGITVVGVATTGVSTFNNIEVTGVATVGSATTLFSEGIYSAGVTSSKSYYTNSTVGDGTDVGYAIKYYVVDNGSNTGYRFSGPGVVNTTDNPTLYLHRGFTYIFENGAGGSHPFAIRYSSGGTGYGSTYLSGSEFNTQILTVPFDAPATLVYQCTVHSGMVGTFNIVS